MIPPIGKMLENRPSARSRSRPNIWATIPVADGMKAPPPMAWTPAQRDQQVDVAGQAAAQRGGGEQDHRAQEDPLPAVLLADLPGQRHDQDLAQRVDGDRPAAPVDLGMQIALERGQRGRDNGLVDGGHHQGQGHDGEDQEPPRRRGPGRGRGRPAGAMFCPATTLRQLLCLPAGNYP